MMMLLRESPIENLGRFVVSLCNENTAPNSHECICQELMEQLLCEWLMELIEGSKV